MGDITTAYANTMLDSMINGSYLGLLSAITDAKAGTVTEFNTTDSPGYTRALPSWSAAANGEKTPSAEVVYPVAQSAWQVAVGVACYSALTAGTLRFAKAFVPIDVGACTTTNGSAVVTTTNNFNTSGIKANMSVTGSGIPADTYVVSVDSNTQVTLSANATASAAVTLTFGAKVRVPAWHVVKLATSALKFSLT